jgi:hypothetical protein
MGEHDEQSCQRFLVFPDDGCFIRTAEMKFESLYRTNILFENRRISYDKSSGDKW